MPVLAEADVVVCGGGTAGISAACCAARHGAKVILPERWPSVGGVAVNALVNIWHTSDRARRPDQCPVRVRGIAVHGHPGRKYL